jgi:outer membrane receptor for ferric coprogen and ferric-rhodotorulic acid
MQEYRSHSNGQPVASATGKDSYTDGEQELRGLMGLEWQMPDGYSIAGEASTTSSGTWTLSIGLAQALR